MGHSAWPPSWIVPLSERDDASRTLWAALGKDCPPWWTHTEKLLFTNLRHEVFRGKIPPKKKKNCTSISMARSVFITTSSRGLTRVWGAAGIRWKRFMMAEQIFISYTEQRRTGIVIVRNPYTNFIIHGTAWTMRNTGKNPQEQNKDLFYLHSSSLLYLALEIYLNASKLKFLDCEGQFSNLVYCTTDSACWRSTVFQHCSRKCVIFPSARVIAQFKHLKCPPFLIQMIKISMC